MKINIKPLFLFLFALLTFSSCFGNANKVKSLNDYASKASGAGTSNSYRRNGSPDESIKSNKTNKIIRTIGTNKTIVSNDSCLRFAMPVTPKGIPEQILMNDAYVSSFNKETLMPNWVAWRLTAGHATGSVKRNGKQFMPDDRVSELYRVTTYDYMRSGYDRGHMCPAGDNKWSETAMEQCFLLTNICPQDHGLNVGDWNEMENQCRRWAKKYGEIYIVCGPILYKGKHKRIGQQHKVTVPEAFFKVVLCLKGEPWGVGFIYKNEGGDRPKGDYQNTIKQVERITGLNFFPSLPSNIEDKVETEMIDLQ